MSSELQKYIKTTPDKKDNLFNADVINFPKDRKLETSKDLQLKEFDFWRINDQSNVDQLRAVIGICFMFIALIVMGIYSNLI